MTDAGEFPPISGKERTGKYIQCRLRSNSRGHEASLSNGPVLEQTITTSHRMVSEEKVREEKRAWVQIARQIF
jgi:hypothetical protein